VQFARSTKTFTIRCKMLYIDVCQNIFENNYLRKKIEI